MYKRIIKILHTDDPFHVLSEKDPKTFSTQLGFNSCIDRTGSVETIMVPKHSTKRESVRICMNRIISLMSSLSENIINDHKLYGMFNQPHLHSFKVNSDDNSMSVEFSIYNVNRNILINVSLSSMAISSIYDTEFVLTVQKAKSNSLFFEQDFVLLYSNSCSSVVANRIVGSDTYSKFALYDMDILDFVYKSIKEDDNV